MLRETAELLRSGGVVVFPTDTLYGLGAAISDPAAVERVRTVKRLPREEPLLVLVPDRQWALALARPSVPAAEEIMEALWPGALTLVLPASPQVPPWIRGARDTVAVRLPLPGVAVELARAVGGPLTGPSANRHGEAPVTSGVEAARRFGDEVDIVLDGGPLTAEEPSTILDLSGALPRLVRTGAVREELLARWLSPGSREGRRPPRRRAAKGKAAPHDQEPGVSTGRESRANRERDPGVKEERPPGRGGPRASPLRVLLVCAGNTCRSPMAAAILASLVPAELKDRLEVVSAGTTALDGAPASPQAIAAAAAGGFALDGHRARRLTKRLVVDADLVLTMERTQLETVRSLAPEAWAKVFLLSAFAAGECADEGDPIADPMGADERAYRRTFAELKAILEEALPRLTELIEGTTP